VTRLLDLGVPGYLINSTLLGVMAQRLVRTLCPHCKKPVESPDEDAWRTITFPYRADKPAQVMGAVGCLECRMTGYLGRMGLYEIMSMSPALRKLVHGEAEDGQLREQAYKDGMKPLRVSGAMKVAQGLTTAEEVLKVAPVI
jgi:general secretion pathway protein E